MNLIVSFQKYLIFNVSLRKCLCKMWPGKYLGKAIKGKTGKMRQK
jgi:hypothetical protein